MIRKLTFVFVQITVLAIFGKWHFFCSAYSDMDVEQINKEWDECCRRDKAVCHGDSCYTLEMQKPATWGQVRGRCRGRFPKVSRSVDLLQITDSATVDKLYTLVSGVAEWSNCKEGFCKTFWTSGFTCGKNTGLDHMKWAASNTSISNELIAAKEPPDREDCSFLVVTVDLEKKKAEYEFQPQDKKHQGICEFMKIKRKTTTTTTTTTTPKTTTTTTPQTTTTPTPETTTTTITTTTTTITTTTTTPTTITSLSIIPGTGSLSTKGDSTGDSENPTETEMSTGMSSTTSERRTTVETIESTHQQRTTSEHDVKEGNDGCEERKVGNFYLPKAKPGETVQISCPDGMIGGDEEWICDETTLTFQLRRSTLHHCKQQWIVDLDVEVSSGGNAVELSKRLANKTAQTSLDYGDLPALVDLIQKLLSLFTEQQKEEMGLLETENPSYHFTKSLVTCYNHVLKTDDNKAWKFLDQGQKLKEASRIIRQVQWSGHRLSCFEANEHEMLQHALSEENIRLETFHLDHHTDNRRHHLVFPTQFTNSSLIVPANIKFQRPPPPICKDNHHKTAVGILYKNIGDYLQSPETENPTSVVVSPIISFSISNTTQTIPLPEGTFIRITLERNDIQKEVYANPKCVFWNFSRRIYGDWDTTGCFSDGNNKTHTNCSCNHLTNFALLMDLKGTMDPKDDDLKLMTLICCSVSMFALLATCLAMLGIKEMRSRRSTITCNLCVCLLLLNSLILFGFDQTGDKILCAVVAGLVQFSLLSAFCWMLMEGFHLYQMVVLVFYQSYRLPLVYYYLIGYGIPLVIVGISASVRYKDYGTENVCWLSNENHLMWSVMGPIAIICCANLFIFIKTMLSASSARIKKEQRIVRKVRSWLKGSLSILCLLGLTWSVGFLYMIEKLHFTSYIFTALNGLQGVFIFIFHVLLNEKATNALIQGFNTNRNRYGVQRKARTHTASSNQPTCSSKKSLTGSDSSLIRCADATNGAVTQVREPIPCQQQRNGSLYIRNSAAERTLPPRIEAARVYSY